tara:strand:- start:1123 stop:1887 length:765 start_codon:yes stop_codon:yes gene_type:complete
MDISKIKSRLNQLQSTNTSNSFWKPPSGKTQIRIVPYKFNKDNPFVELFFHYGLGNNKTYLSPASFGKPDPVEDFANKLKSAGNKDEWIQGKRLEPKMRTYAPIVVRGEEHEGVKWYGFGKTVYQELLGVIADPDYGDITDPTMGRDIVVERQSPAEAGNQYGKTSIRVKPNQTPLTENKETLQKVIDSQTKLEELWEEPTYDDLKEALHKFLNPSDNDSDEEVASTVPSNGSANMTAKTVNKVDDAFDELFNN